MALATRKSATVDVWDVALVGAAAAPVLIFLAAAAGQHLPPLDAILDGKELLPPADPQKANLVRNLFELTSFIATTALLLTALWAFVFTKTQIEEATAARLAALYATLEARWASPEMQESKTIFAEIIDGYDAVVRAARLAGCTSPSLPEFADGFVQDLRHDDCPRYFKLIALLEYLEYIGMLEQQGYLELKDIDYILGSVCIDVYSVMATHIERVRANNAAPRRKNNLARMPDDFVCFSRLTRKFTDRYRTR